MRIGKPWTHAIEEIGFDGLWVSETAHDPFLPLTLAAEHSRRLSLGTGIALPFPRSPAILAYLAWDLARFSQGRFGATRCAGLAHPGATPGGDAEIPGEPG